MKYLSFSWINNQCEICDQGEINIKTESITGLNFKTCDNCGSEYADKQTMNMQAQTKLSNIKTTKICPKCGCDKMISFHSLNKKTCSECGNTVSWPLEDGQKRTF